MELHLLKASMYSRASLFLILDYLTIKDYSREFGILITKIKDYYERDNNAPAVNKELFLAMLEQTVPNPKHFQRFKLLIEEALLLETSVENVNELIVQAKLYEVGLKLSTALSNNEQEKASKLMEEYRVLEAANSIEDLENEGIEVYTAEDMERILQHAESGADQLKVYPLALSERMEHRAGPGHHIVVFARPEMGKTAICLTIAGGFARQGSPGLYLINEDQTEDVYVRSISNLTGLTRPQIMADRGNAMRLAHERGFGNIRFISLTPGNPRQVEAFIDKFQPGWVMIDQARNLDMKESNKVIQLEKAAQFSRVMGKKYGALMVSVFQAGDSAEGKRVLDMGDLDFSNTGVQGAADVMAGVGGTKEDTEKGIRFINLSKNKIGGRHENFPVKLHPQISRYTSMSESA